jgi:hypothetical protein
MGIQIAASDNGHPSLPSARVLVQNNLMNDINSANWGSSGVAFGYTQESSPLVSPYDVTIDHNTLFPSGKFLLLGDHGTAGPTKITNNLSSYGTYGIFGSGAGSGTLALTTFLPNLTYSDNVLITASGSSQGAYPSATHWNSQAGVDFTDFAGGNFQLLSRSHYHNAGTDGKDIGVWDWACLNNDAVAALAGKFVPSPNGCALSVDLLLLPPTNVKAEVEVLE